MVLGIEKKGKGKGDHPDFSPTESEMSIVQSFLDDREIPMMGAKTQILENDQIMESRRGPLSDWVRQFRADHPRPYVQDEAAGLEGQHRLER